MPLEIILFWLFGIGHVGRGVAGHLEFEWFRLEKGGIVRFGSDGDIGRGRLVEMGVIGGELKGAVG